jgi:glycosyltransferase involved in cell wall biosynthesis
MSSPPLFSIVIPVFNRPSEIRRALHSCVSQPFPSFEVIVVDDASSDKTMDIVRECTDIRVVAVQHDSNRGVCAARNTGVAQARGEWIIFLDSDDELLPGALGIIAKRVAEAPSTVQRLAFNYVHADGSVSPAPSSYGEVLDYAGYLRWADCVKRSDFSNCIRRSTFDSVRLPESRVYERIYHLDFARRFDTWMAPDIVARVHDDAANRLTNVSLPGYVRRQMMEARHGIQGIENILQRHGEGLRRYAPRTFRSILRQHFEMLFLAGRPVEGIRAGITFLRAYPTAASGWATLAAGLLGPLSVAALKFVNARRRA